MGGDAGGYELVELWGDGEELGAEFQGCSIDHAVLGKDGVEVHVLFAAGDVFREGEIVYCETPAATGESVGIRKLDQAFAPPGGQDCGFFGNAVGEIAEGSPFERTFADGAVYHVTAIREILRKDVSFAGNQKFCRGLWKLPEDRLTTYHDDVGFVCDYG